MYVLQGNNIALNTLMGTPKTGYERRLVKELIHSALKKNPELKYDLLPSDEQGGGKRENQGIRNPLVNFVRFRKMKEIEKSLDRALLGATPSFLVKMIQFLRSEFYECLLAVYPQNAEVPVLYGGRSVPSTLYLGVRVPGAGNIFLAQSQTMSKSEVLEVVHALGTKNKFRMGQGDSGFDLYRSLSQSDMPQKFHVWEP